MGQLPTVATPGGAHGLLMRPQMKLHNGLSRLSPELLKAVRGCASPRSMTGHDSPWSKEWQTTQQGQLPWWAISYHLLACSSMGPTCPTHVCNAHRLGELLLAKWVKCASTKRWFSILRDALLVESCTGEESIRMDEGDSSCGDHGWYNDSCQNPSFHEFLSTFKLDEMLLVKTAA